MHVHCPIFCLFIYFFVEIALIWISIGCFYFLFLLPYKYRHTNGNKMMHNKKEIVSFRPQILKIIVIHRLNLFCLSFFKTHNKQKWYKLYKNEKKKCSSCVFVFFIDSENVLIKRTFFFSRRSEAMSIKCCLLRICTPIHTKHRRMALVLNNYCHCCVLVNRPSY